MPTDLQPVPLLDFSREYAEHRDELLAAVTAVLDSQRLILGPAVTEFESLAAAALEVDHALGCSSGTDALWLALAALEVGPGQAVVTTPFSFFATVSTILRAGAQPILADIDPLTFNLCPTSTAEAIERHHSSQLSSVAAILPVHLYGQCADMDAFTTLAAQHGAVVVEDAAQAFGARFNDAPAGTLGNAAAFSFYPTKNLAALGDAGLVTTTSATTAERATMLRAHGMRKRYYHDEIGWNARIDSLQAAALTVRLRYLESGNQRRREIAALYDSLLTSANLTGPTIEDGIVLPYTDPRAHHVFHQYVLRVPRRDELRAHLTALNIGSEIYYPLPLHLQTSLADLGYQPGEFPHAEKAAAEVLAFPIYPHLRNDEIETVVEAIRRFYA